MCPRSIESFKPLEDMQNLIDAMLPFAQVRSSRPNRNFYYSERGQSIIYLVKEGTIFVHRISDNMVVATGYSPLIIGLTNEILMGEADYFFTAETDLSFAVISLKKAMEIIKEKNLWQSYSAHQAYLLKYITLNSARIAALPAYEVIRNQLLNLQQEPDEIRLNITAAQYIQARTRLSRSGIMKILSELKSGGYISISEGTLLDISKLPANY
jgi:CRP-like cAMP-binding protein